MDARASTPRAAFAKADIYSHRWGRLDSWWSAGKVGCFALVAFGPPRGRVKSTAGSGATSRRDQKLKRGFALGRAGDRDGGLGAAARAASSQSRRRSLEGDQGGDAGTSSSRGMVCTTAISFAGQPFPPAARTSWSTFPPPPSSSRAMSFARSAGADAEQHARGAPITPIIDHMTGPPRHITPILAAIMNPRIHMMLIRAT